MTGWDRKRAETTSGLPGRCRRCGASVWWRFVAWTNVDGSRHGHREEPHDA
jgi:hypothetical protein